MKNTLLTKLLIVIAMCIGTKNIWAQNVPITMEPGGHGANWTWTVFENGPTPPPITVVANPSMTAPNSSANVLKMTAMQAGNPWAGFECAHGDIGSFTLNASNAIVKVMVYKPVISDVGVKFVIPGNGALVEIKKPNTLINQWEELSFDFSSRIGNPNTINMDQIVIFPDFNARTQNNVCYIDNVSFHPSSGGSANINVKFGVQATDSTPVYLFGNWNNWSGFPGVPMPLNATTGNYEVTIPLTASTTIEYLYVNGSGTKEVMNPAGACTNGNTQFTNRVAVLGNSDMSLCNRWATCNTCIPLSVNNFTEVAFGISISKSSLVIQANNITHVDQVEIFDVLGKNVFRSNGPVKTENNLQVNLCTNTLYLVRVKQGQNYYTVKSFINE